MFTDNWTETTTFESRIRLDQSFEEASDLRADLVSSVAVAMTSRVAVKLSLQLLFDNQPAFESVPITDQSSLLTGDFIAVELDELDSIFTASVVLTF